MPSDELYKQNILDHYKHPSHKGVLNPCDVSAKAANKSCGDDLTLYMNVRDGRITEVTFGGDGCAISIAGASMLLNKLTGMQVAEARTLSESDLFALFGIPIGPARSKCALLAYSALQETLTKL